MKPKGSKRYGFQLNWKCQVKTFSYFREVGDVTVGRNVENKCQCQLFVDPPTEYCHRENQVDFLCEYCIYKTKGCFRRGLGNTLFRYSVWAGYLASATDEKSFSQTTLYRVRSVVIFCKAFLVCSTGHWSDTAATVEPNWWPELQKENKTKHHYRADATHCMYTFALPRDWGQLRE